MNLEQFYKKIEDYNPQPLLDEIKEGLIKARSLGDLSDNKEYDYWRNKQAELEEDKLYRAKKAYILLKEDNDNLSYREYLNHYNRLRDYALEQGVDNFTFDSLKAKLIEEHFFKKDDIEVDFFPTLDMYDNYEKDYYFHTYQKQYEEVISYFKNQGKRDFIYVWDLENLLLAYYVEKLLGNEYINSFFTYGEHDYSIELIELKRNILYLSNNLRKNKKLNLSLYLWTIYKLYWYFRKRFNTFIIYKEEFTLLKHFFEIVFFLNNHKVFALDDAPQSYKGTDFINGVCSILSNDLICTLLNNFPTYYSTNIIFLGYGLHTPAGCSALTTDMSSFDSFINGIGDYDYWLGFNFGSALLEKYQIEKDYEKLITTIFGGSK